MGRFTPDDAVSSGPAGFTDAFSLGIKAADSTTVPTDAATFAMALALSDSNASQSETVTLGISGTGFSDSSTAPSDANSFTMRVWLSGSAGTGVTNPSNADGANNATNASVQTAVAGPTTETMTSQLGSNVPTATVTSVVYRGWFQSANQLVTSTGSIILHSATAAFTDITMFTNSALNTTVDHSSGDFTFDVVAAGVNTLAKIQSCEVLHRTTDAAAGVTPHVLTVDAGCFEIVGAFT